LYLHHQWNKDNQIYNKTLWESSAQTLATEGKKPQKKMSYGKNKEYHFPIKPKVEYSQRTTKRIKGNNKKQKHYASHPK
jgi:hypothetical protein